MDIAFATSGGKPSNKYLKVTLTLRDDLGNLVTGASVSVVIDRDPSGSWSLSGTTGTGGTVTLAINNAPSGIYTTTVYSVSTAQLEWIVGTPNSSFTK